MKFLSLSAGLTCVAVATRVLGGFTGVGAANSWRGAKCGFVCGMKRSKMQRAASRHKTVIAGRAITFQVTTTKTVEVKLML